VVRHWIDRYSFAALLTVSVVLLVLTKADIRAVGYLAGRVDDAAVPVLDVVRQPVAALRNAADQVGAMMALRDENARLRREADGLLRWQAEAIRLEAQNASLRRLLRMPHLDQAPLWTTARVVADSGGPFVQTVLIDAGAGQGVAKGMAVANERGLVGRVIAVGRSSARVLLLTDLNSQIPVIVDRSQDAAILEGTNDGLPRLRFLPLGPAFRVGDRVLTSGRGGVLPPGLGIGVISRIAGKDVVVTPFVDWARLDYVAVIEYRPVARPEDDPAAAAPAPRGVGEGAGPPIRAAARPSPPTPATAPAASAGRP
jgi:rod shape-determining protein MreC